MIWMPKNSANIIGLPIKSDKVAQPILPAPLNSPMIPTMVAAATTPIPAYSWAMGDATEIIAIPQEMFMKSINHKYQNLLVFTASLAVSWERSAFTTFFPDSATALNPSGIQSFGGGARYNEETN